MDIKIFYAELTPCDDMQNYKEAPFVPEFIKNSNPNGAPEQPASVIQVATPFGWCIVAKWFNNGTTHIYAQKEETLRAGVDILGGACDSGDCDYACGDFVLYTRSISAADNKVFYGHATPDPEETTRQALTPTAYFCDEVYVNPVNWDQEHQEYMSVRIPTPFAVTVLVSNLTHFHYIFDNEPHRQTIVQYLRDAVMQEYNSKRSFPKQALAPYKADGEATFAFHHLERDKCGERLFVYYEFESTIS